MKDVVKEMEIQLEISLPEKNIMRLSKAEADVRRYLHIKEEFWKQKAGMKWFTDTRQAT